MKSNTAPMKILFFTPYAGRTGSEIMLFSVLNRLDPQKFSIELVAMRNGELLSHPNNFRTHGIEQTNIASRAENYIRKKITGTGSLEKKILSIHDKFKPDLWYLNTVVMPEVAGIASRHGIRYAVHFHELQFQFNLVGEEELKMQAAESDFLIGCSTPVCDAIRTLAGREPELLYECVDFSAMKPDAGSTADFRKKHNIPHDCRIITMSGQRSEIKGFDIFIDVARQLKDEKIYFVWLGNSRHTGYNLFYEKILQKEKLNVVLDYPDPALYYAALDAADLFFLSSRSDPFPLVMIEAAFLGKYIFALPSGGVAEFCQPGIGTVFPSFDPVAIAAALKHTLDSRPADWKPSLSKTRAEAFDATAIARRLEMILATKLIS